MGGRSIGKVNFPRASGRISSVSASSVICVTVPSLHYAIGTVITGGSKGYRYRSANSVPPHRSVKGASLRKRSTFT